MVYNITITQKDKFLDKLYVLGEDGFNNTELLDKAHNNIIMSDKRLDQKIIDYFTEKFNIRYKNHDELYIGNQYCYLFQEKRRRKKKCN
jgi:hypothetical protein